MDESAQSDADKIRMKRLAKLGAGPSTDTNNNSSAAPGDTRNPSNQAPLPARSATSVPSNVSSLSQPSGSQHRKQPVVSDVGANAPAQPVVTGLAAIGNTSKEKVARQANNNPESLETWQDRTLRSVFRVTLSQEEITDAHGHKLIFLAGTREDLEEQNAPTKLSIDNLEGVITEAAGQAPSHKPFAYLLACFKRLSRVIRSLQSSSINESKLEILKEARRLCLSYCMFAVTMPEMFGDNTPSRNPMVDHLLAEPEGDAGICTDFLTEASSQYEQNEMVKDVVQLAAEELSRNIARQDMLSDYQNHVRALRNLTRFPKIVDAITKSTMWAPADIQAQDIEVATLLGPFFRISPMQLSVAQNYFSAPKTRDASFIANAQNAIRLTLRTHQSELFQIVNAIVRSGAVQREKMLDWFAQCVNQNHKKRAMRVDFQTVSSDGFMVNVTVVLDQLCEPFMDTHFGKIERIDPEYLRRSPRVDVHDETKINADQKAADEYYTHAVDGINNFISEVFFLAVAAHHYGSEAAQIRMSTLRKTVQRHEKDLETVEADRHKYANQPAYLARFEQYIERAKKQIDDDWSTIHATHGALLDDLNQARSMQFMRYVIVWLLRLASRQDLPQQSLDLPLPIEQSEVFRCLPEYFLEDIVDNFKFITNHIPHIVTPQQCEEIIQVCITFLRSTEYIKNPGVKSGLVTILFYGVQPVPGRPRGVLGDSLIGSPFAHRHLLHALMRFYIEAESTGTHTQFYDKFNIRYEIFQVIKKIWENTMYRENLAKEALVNTDFFVQFVNMLVNDATFVLDESLSSFVKIHDLRIELASPEASSLSEEQRKEKQDLLEDNKSKAKSYMGLTRETMEALQLFTKTLSDAFTMPEIVQRLADMLDYNLDIMVGPKSINLRVGDSQEEMRREYNFNPGELLRDIVSIFINLAHKQRFVDAIARDGRSYKPSNFAEASKILSKRVLASPEELQVWMRLGGGVALTKSALEEEEEDLGEIPDEFLDPLLSDIMVDPVILPNSRNTVDRSTIRSHLLSDPTDPFNRMPLKVEDVIPNVELKQRIELWKAERKAARALEKQNCMDTTS